MFVSKNKILFILPLLIGVNMTVLGQFYNKEIAAKILIEPSSEFITLKAGIENKTPTDYSLIYEYSLFTTNEDSTVSKSSEKKRFFMKSGTRKIVNKLTLNYYFDKKSIILLIVYDENGKPLGKDRLVLEKGGQTDLKPLLEEQVVTLGVDQAKPQDGFIKQGFVIKKAITKSGRDFFRYFHSQYIDKQIVTDKNIFITETFGRGRNTRIIVKIEDQIIYQFFAQPRKEFLTQKANEAFNFVLRRLQVLEKQKTDFIRY